ALPEEIKQLKGLKSLILSKNLFASIPDILFGCQGLETIVLKDNSLSEVSEKIKELSNLKKLDFSGNKLKALPEEIKQLKGLKSLILSKNLFASIPDILFGCQSLETIVLKDNSILEVPQKIKELSNLKKLDLSGNMLKALPEEIKQLKELKTLALSKNQFTFIPDILLDRQDLEAIIFKDNSLSNVPEKIRTFSKLKMLDLSGNQISELSDSIFLKSKEGSAETEPSFPQLKNLFLGKNKLKALPKGLEKYQSLEIVDFSENLLGSSFNKNSEKGEACLKNISSWENLEMLKLNGNKLESLPEGLANCVRLKVLDSSGNLIKSVSLSKEKNALKNLTMLFLQDNELKELSGLESCQALTTINLANNKIENLSNEFESLEKLHTLFLDKNLIKSLPGSLGECQKLQYLTFTENPESMVPGSISVKEPGLIKWSDGSGTVQVITK
ncbi:MAG: leucine-rich repeat protein, partial [Cytophagales bacterium]|nr:leucine-rich repeat protein [Cytophagales bacterium]